MPNTVKGTVSQRFFEWKNASVSLSSVYAKYVAAVARRFGGGGHKNAAGLTLDDPSEAAERQLIDDVVEVVQAAAPA